MATELPEQMVALFTAMVGEVLTVMVDTATTEDTQAPLLPLTE